jgi:phosphate-transporting ATPase
LLLRAIADLDAITGEVSLDGVPREDMSGPTWRRIVGYVPAEPGWWGDRVDDHFADWAIVAPLVERLGLPAGMRDWPISRPSTGERSRLALVRALVRRPKVLLLDEPTAALDAAAAAAVEALIADQVDGGLSVLWVTHNVAQSRRVARRCLIVESGHVRQQDA